jgi:hypothetical protein
MKDMIRNVKHGYKKNNWEEERFMALSMHKHMCRTLCVNAGGGGGEKSRREGLH